MSTWQRPEWLELGDSHRGHDRKRLRERIDRSRWIESLPDDPRERQRVRNRLIALAAALAIAELLRRLFR
jgi:hypothetical protein